jgi:hypothetical protein
MESMRVFDEIQRLGDDLPRMNASVSLNTPLRAKLSELKAEELDVLQCAINHSVVEAVFNNCPVDDSTIAESLVTLVGKGYLQATSPEPEEK